jgi:hypothetical protein
MLNFGFYFLKMWLQWLNLDFMHFTVCLHQMSRGGNVVYLSPELFL